MHSTVLNTEFKAHAMRIAAVGVLLSLIAFPGCYYFQSPKDRTSDSQFDFVRDRCIEIERPALLVKGVSNPISPFDYELRFAEKSLLPSGRGARLVRAYEVGTTFRMVRFVEIYPGLGPRIVTLVKERDGSGPEIDLGEFTFTGFPEDHAEPWGARVVPCELDPPPSREP